MISVKIIVMKKISPSTQEIVEAAKEEEADRSAENLAIEDEEYSDDEGDYEPTVEEKAAAQERANYNSEEGDRNLSRMYNVGRHVTVDEQLILFRGRCPMKQYMPDKPAKYGIKIWATCDSERAFTWITQVYCGKAPNTKPEKNQGIYSHLVTVFVPMCILVQYFNTRFYIKACSSNWFAPEIG